MIDDQIEALELVTCLARSRAHRVFAFADGRHVVGELVEIHPDLVISDLSMPRVSGFEVARAIRAEASLRNLFLVAMSSFSDHGHRTLAQRAGFDAYQVKP